MADRNITAKRGYMSITIRERGNVPRKMKKAFNAASKESWADTAKQFHVEMRDDRFTPGHAKKANYYARRGERIPQGSKDFKRFYYGRKFLSPTLGGGPNRADPLVKTGESRRRARAARISSTSKTGRASYSGLSKFNFRNPASRIRMGEEFRRLLATEIETLAEGYDQRLDEHLKTEDRR